MTQPHCCIKFGNKICLNYYWLVKTYISNRKLIILGSFHGESDALFGFYQECFNSFSTLIHSFINFGTERKHIIFIILLIQIHIIMIMYLIYLSLKSIIV